MLPLRNLPLAYRAIFSCFLIVIGTGYLTALSLMFLTVVQPHAKRGLNIVQDISATYHGLPEVTRLEAALNGPMATMLSDRNRLLLLDWIHEGAKAEDYARVEPIFQENCISCHSAKSGMSVPPLTSYQEIQKVLQTDNGFSIVQLARVSHVHLFGLSLIFLVTGGIFALSEIPEFWRVLLVVAPYISILADIGSWWGTKYLSPVFSYIVIAGGALMGLALAAQIVISLWQMWSEPMQRYWDRSRRQRIYRVEA